MKKMIFIKIIIFVVSLVLLSCETDKYFSSNISEKMSGDSLTISGEILRFDNQEPVAGAKIQIGYYQTYSDSLGSFTMDIIFDQSANQNSGQNSTLPVIIVAEKFLDYAGQELILPIPQDFKFNMIWRVPIVEQSVLLLNPLNENMKVFQAIVTDFEGLDDIVDVNIPLIFREKVNGSGLIILPREEVVLELGLIQKINENSGVFQSEIFNRSIASPYNWIPYKVIALDKNGFKEEKHIDYYNWFPDSPIIPVDWEME